VEISLDGKVTLVIGAGPDIGSGIALALSRHGAHAACNDLDFEAAKAALLAAANAAQANGTSTADP
jgi:NAD(P)-dependent dehydrogenase (short-subunit alcohol dehydrogenase family)